MHDAELKHFHEVPCIQCLLHPYFLIAKQVGSKYYCQVVLVHLTFTHSLTLLMYDSLAMLVRNLTKLWNVTLFISGMSRNYSSKRLNFSSFYWIDLKLTRLLYVDIGISGDGSDRKIRLIKEQTT